MPERRPTLTDEQIDRLRRLLPRPRRPLTDDERANVELWRLRLGHRPPVDDADRAELERWRDFITGTTCPTD